MAFTNTREAVTAIFIGYYDRAPAPNGLNYWVNDIDVNGASVADIARAFAVVPESQGLYPGLTTAGSGDLAADVAFVTAIFQNLFGRDPNNIDGDGSGNFWVQELQNGADVGQLIIDIISGAQGTDLAIIQNKIAVGLAYADAAEAAGQLTRADLGDTILDDVDETEASVILANAQITAEFGDPDPGVPGETFILSTDAARDNLTGTEGNDTFEAFNSELQDGDRMDGGSGTDTLRIFNSDQGPAKAPITTSVEQVVYTNQTNDLNSVADNNVGGYGDTDDTVEVDVEIDAGMMSGVTRWEDYDSRADLVIEDARDQDDTDGTFTGDITVAMVSTDPGNVDYAVYFDQPVNTSQNFGTLEIRVLDQEAAEGLPAPSASSTGYLTESSLIEFTFAFDGQEIRVVLADEEGVTYGADVSFQDLLDQVEAATQQALVDAGVTENLGFSASLGEAVQVGVGNQFTLPLVLTFDVPADTIEASSDDIIVLGRDSGNNGATPSTDTFGALSTVRITEEELIRLNVELDDVGKGSMGGDALFGAMSTGRQNGDDGTSDSIGIQQFDIEVDRSSQLQTINSTNNALEEVYIDSGENNGPNNTTTAADEMAGDLVVRGVANPGVVEIFEDLNDPATPDNSDDDTLVDIINTPSGIDTDSPMPGGVPQHNIFGFSDVRVIDASGMNGVQADGSVASVDLTAELTEEIVEKYLEIQDDSDDGEADDVLFDYDLAQGNDEFLLNMSADALNSAGTGSREDFNLDIDGNGGNDVITTNIGGSSENVSPIFGDLAIGLNETGAVKMIDEQGQDYYVLNSTNGEDWYENSVSNIAATFSVDGGAGNDVIWTHGWGDFEISDGDGMDVVYTDNSGVVSLSNAATNIDRNLLEHEQIDYVMGSVWVFNGEDDNGAIDGDILGDGHNLAQLSGDTNDTFIIGRGELTTTFTGGTATIAVAFEGLSATADEAYVDTAEIDLSDDNYTAVDGSDDTVSIDEQTMNQAIKEAINGSAVLSQVLEAVDGPGNSLIVYSKIDGSVLDADTLNVSVVDVTVNGTDFAPELTNTAYTEEGYENFAAAADAADDSDDDPATDPAADVANNGNSDAESDNTIFVAGDGDSDVFVLSTNDSVVTQPTVNGSLDDATDLNGASNETLMFDDGFGVDTVFNFDGNDGDASDDGTDGAEDVLDFSMITGAANSYATGFSAGGDEVVIDTVANVDAGTAGVDAADVVAYFLATGGSDGTGTGASEHILIVYDTTGDNGGEVWHITDGAGTGDVTAVEEGTINLIGTAWASVTADNIG